jgi:hypothetical protein
MTAMVLFLIETEVNDVSVYSSSESLTGDLEVYDVDAGVFQVYDPQARYLPLTWQAPDPRSREAGQACLGPPQQGQEDRLYDALRRFLPLIGRADLADAPVLDLQAAAQAISDYHRGPSSVQDGDGPGKGAQVPLLQGTLNSYPSCFSERGVLRFRRSAQRLSRSNCKAAALFPWFHLVCSWSSGCSHGAPAIWSASLIRVLVWGVPTGRGWIEAPGTNLRQEFRRCYSRSHVITT